MSRDPSTLRSQLLAVVPQVQELLEFYAGRVAFNIASMFHTKPIEPKTADDLVRTWQNWVALSGDHLVEQHVHNIDVANWFCGVPAKSAVGFGGRAQRAAGDMYDSFSIDYEYGDGVHIHSMCRQVNNCFNWVGHDFVFEKGHADGRGFRERNGRDPERERGPNPRHQLNRKRCRRNPAVRKSRAAAGLPAPAYGSWMGHGYNDGGAITFFRSLVSRVKNRR